MDKAQYIHRLGRTARAGKNGKGFLLLGDYERRFLNTLSDLPLSEAQPIQAQAMQKAQADMQRGLAAVDYQSKAQVAMLAGSLGIIPVCRVPTVLMNMHPWKHEHPRSGDFAFQRRF